MFAVAFPVGAFAGVMLIFAFAASFLPVELSFAICMVFLVSGIVIRFVVKKYRNAAILIFAAALGMILSAVNLGMTYYPEKALIGKRANVIGTVTEISVARGNPQYTVESESISIDGAPQRVKFKLSGWGEQDISPYDKISCDVSFLGEEESKIFEILVNRSHKTNLYAYMESFPEIVERETKTFGYYIYAIRKAITSVICENFSDWRIPFTKELLLGTRGELPDDIISVFRYAGMSHILAISGLHLSIIIGLADKFLRNTKIGKNSRKRRIILIIATILYMFVAGLGKSVLRAGTMLIATQISDFLRTEVASKDRLGAAIILILFMDPLSACDVGFLLSVASSASIISFSVPLGIWFSKNILKERGKLYKTLGKTFGVTVSAWLASLPISLVFFGGVSIAAPLANMVSSILVSGAISFSMLSVIFGFVPFLGIFSAGSAYIAEIFENIIYSIAKFFANLPLSYVNSKNVWVVIWILGSAAAVLIPIILTKRYSYVKLSALVSAAALLSGIFFNTVIYANTVSTEIISVKNGTAILCSNSGSSVLISGGISSEDIYKLKSKADILVSLAPKGASEELSLVKKVKPEFAVVSRPETAERYEGARMFSPGTLTFWNDSSIRFLSDGIYEIDVGGTLILYISEKCDIINIEPRFRKADIAIFDGVSPVDFPKMRCKTAVLRQPINYVGTAAETEILEEGTVCFCSRGKNIKKGWISA